MKIGKVVDAVGANRKQLFNGKEYDYVFDIDAYEGAPPLKLPYNVTGILIFHLMSENPYRTAQGFIDQHELPQGYLDQIANFILNNTKGQSLGASANERMADPLTGL